MYNKGDDTYLGQPKFMSRITMLQVIERIEEHCLHQNEKRFLVIFHGGEPLLASKDSYRFFVEQCRKRPAIQVDFALQTNGVLVDTEWCQLFDELGINVGFSLDGTRESHDQYRVYHSGKGSFDDIMEGIKAFKLYKPDDLAVITVMNIDYEPLDIYHYYKSIGINRWNVLLPDYSHDDKPEWLRDASQTVWADKMIPLFDYWLDDTDPARPSINIFRTIISLIVGLENAGDDHFGLRANNTLVVETDGGIEATDPLRACGNGFTKEGLNVASHGFAEALSTPLAQAYINSHQQLCRQCQSCPIVDTCGGGYLVHRYSGTNAFDNPSVYCANLKKLIVHIHNTIIARSAELGRYLQPLDFNMVMAHSSAQVSA